MHRRTQLPAQRSLAGADLAGDQPNAAQLDQVIQARLGFARHTGDEQFIGLQRALEGVVGEAKVGEIHQRFCSSWGVRAARSRSASPVLRGAAGGVSGSMFWVGRLRRTKQLA